MKNLFIISIIFFQFLCAGETVNKIKNRSYIKNWVIAGPFPNILTETQLPDGNNRLGFYTDMLESLGGEQKARLHVGQKVLYSSKSDIYFEPKLVQAEDNGIIDFEKIYGSISNKAAYAYCEIESETDQTIHFLFGSDDGAKVWINGKLVHSIFAGRAVKAGEDYFKADLKKGLNQVLVKITQWVRGWAFIMESLTESEYILHLQQQKDKENFLEFLDTDLSLKGLNTWNVFFNPGEFPDVVWDKPYLVENAVGNFPLKVQWFDKDFNEVTFAKTPGRYAYYAEGTTETGINIRRSKTVFCMPWDWVVWGERPKAYLDALPVSFINKEAWEYYKEPIADYVGRTLLLSILNQKEGAVLMSYLYDLQNDSNSVDKLKTPLVQDHEFHIKMKQKILNVENKWPELKPPAKSKNENSILRNGTLKEAGVTAETPKLLNDICNDWYQESKESFNIHIARNGVILLDAAYGERLGEKINKQTTSEIASITKLLTGMLFARFVDQGLINIDDPIGKFLPDFPVEGDQTLTLRHCFTHTSGLWSHEEWGGIHNPWLDNVVSNTLKDLSIGKVYEYNGMGYDLAGKVMEIVSGKSLIRLFREQYFDPLNLSNTVLEEDLAFSCFTNARELAVLAQLLLNGGSYGKLKFFSPETIKDFMPQSLEKYYPGITAEQGIGITWMHNTHPDAGKNGLKVDETILSKNTIGHGSATSSIFMVDLDNKLVITQSRRRAGKAYERYLEKLLLALRDGIN